MKKLSYLLMILFLVSCGNEKSANISSDTSKQTTGMKITAQAIIAQMEKGKYKEGELLVKFKSGVVTSSSLKAHQAVGASVAKRFSIVPNLELVELPQGLSVKDAITRYMSDADVEYAVPNYIRHAVTVIPNDQFFGQQWALRNTGQFAGGTLGADINATAAWDISRGSSVIAAVLDSGIDYNHPDLIENIWTNKGWDFTTCAKFSEDQNGQLTCVTPKSTDNDPMDDFGHGTHVAGIIGAVGNNNLGIAGVMWTVQLMAVKFLNADGEGTSADEIAGIEYAVTNGAKIINASFGGSEFDPPEKDAIVSANSANVLMAAAAGNNGTNNDLTPFFPASYTDPEFGGLPNIISVASTNQNDIRSSFSNFGLNSVHVAAPGEYILSTVPPTLSPLFVSLCTSSPFAGYDFCAGTSMSTPHVSGLAGLLYSYYTGFTSSQIRGTILRYVDPLPTLSGLIQTGGRINAYRSISSLSPPTGLSFIPSTNQIIVNWTNHATGADQYTIEHKSGSDSYSIAATLNADIHSFTDAGLIDGTAYTYMVKAINYLPNPPGADAIRTESLPLEATTATLIKSPTGLTATAVSSSQVNLAWTETSQTEEGFAIERSSDGNFAQIAVVGPNVVTYSDSGLSPATKYTYRVRAFNTAAGNSAYSNEAAVTTLTTGGSPVTSGGGGCSIGARQNTPTVVADLAVMLVPLMVIVVMRRRR